MKVETSVINVTIEKEVYDKIRAFTEQFGQREIGGWLTGSIEGSTVHVDGLLIPPQETSVGDVEIGDDDLIMMRREYGAQVCARIIGHWHSHHTMGAFWSSTDEANMTQIMQPREKFLFIVTASQGKRELVRFDKKIANPNVYLKFDDLILRVADPQNQWLEWCKEQWDLKVRTAVIPVGKKGNKYLPGFGKVDTSKLTDADLDLLEQQLAEEGYYGGHYGNY